MNTYLVVLGFVVVFGLALVVIAPAAEVGRRGDEDDPDDDGIHDPPVVIADGWWDRVTGSR